MDTNSAKLSSMVMSSDIFLLCSLLFIGKIISSNASCFSQYFISVSRNASNILSYGKIYVIKTTLFLFTSLPFVHFVHTGLFGDRIIKNLYSLDYFLLQIKTSRITVIDQVQLSCLPGKFI